MTSRFNLSHFLLGLICLIHFSGTSASPTFIQSNLPLAKEIGSARMTYLFWDVYDATLYAPNGIWHEDQPYALSLTYLRDLEGEAIAKRSIEEIREQGFEDNEKLHQWQELMVSLFPNVSDQSNITGIRSQQGFTHFYHNGELIGSIEDPLFTIHFFNIWLGEKTSEPKLRKALLGFSQKGERHDNG